MVKRRRSVYGRSAATKKRRKRTYVRVKRRIMAPLIRYGGRRELKGLHATAAGGGTAGGSQSNIHLENSWHACLNLISQGDDNTTRDGRRINLHDLYLSLPIISSSSTINNARVMVFLDKSPNSGSLVTEDDILSSVPNKAEGYVDQDKKDRFIMLCDERRQLGGSAGDVNYQWDFQKHIKLRGAETVYSGTTSSIGALQTGGLYVMVLSSGSTGAGCKINGAGAMLLRWFDQ